MPFPGARSLVCVMASLTVALGSGGTAYPGSEPGNWTVPSPAATTEGEEEEELVTEDGNTPETAAAVGTQQKNETGSSATQLGAGGTEAGTAAPAVAFSQGEDADNTTAGEELGTASGAASWVFGEAALRRAHQEEFDWQDTMYVLAPALPRAGVITEWELYAEPRVGTTQLNLMVWRPARCQACTALTFTLLHSLPVTVPPALGPFTITLDARDELMHVDAGDHIGIYFKDANPIPFDKADHCAEHTHFIKNPAPADEPLNTCRNYVFREHAAGWSPCRRYSINVRLNSTSSPSELCGFHPAVALEPSTPAVTPAAADTLDPDDIEVRLVHGIVPGEGLVEVRAAAAGATPPGEWGTVCDDGWDDADATVVCRQLGYKAGVARFPPLFGHGAASRSVWLDDLMCNGTERRLADCRHRAAWGQHDCQHTEDAGAACFIDSHAEPAPVPAEHVLGYPAVARYHQDRWEHGVYIPHPHHRLPWATATLTAWHFYVQTATPDTSVGLTLQVWRPRSASEFQLVGETEFKALGTGEHNYSLPSSEAFAIQAGDVLGIKFSEGYNPIPFDVITGTCNTAERVMYMSPGQSQQQLSREPRYRFTSKLAAWQGCRMYSLNARYTGTDTGHYEFRQGLSQYRVLPGGQLTAEEAEAACRKEMGPAATLAQISSEDELLAVSGALNALGSSMSFWIAGHASEALPYAHWGECQPEKGKECIVLKKSSVLYSSDVYLMYSQNCHDLEKYICENITTAASPASDVTSVVPSIQNYESLSKTKGLSGGVIGGVVVVVLVILGCLVLVLLVIYRRRHIHRGESDSESSVRFVHLDEKAAL